MRKIVITILFLAGFQIAHAQNPADAQNAKYNSLKNLLASAKDDSTRFARFRELFLEYLWSYPDSSMSYVQQEILLAKQMQSDIELSTAYFDYGWFNIIIGNYPQALNAAQEALKSAEKAKNFLSIANAYSL